jgi:uncharacterized protein YhdP
MGPGVCAVFTDTRVARGCSSRFLFRTAGRAAECRLKPAARADHNGCRIAGQTQLGKDLPDLELAALKGRIGWKQLKDGFEITTSKLSMTTLEHTHQPADFLLRYYAATASKPAHGELEANALDLEPLFKLADHLPFEPELRKGLDRFAPRGSVYDLAAKWSGSWPQPNQYTAKAKFADVGWSASGRIPGFSGASGSIDGNELGGTLSAQCPKHRGRVAARIS